MAVNRPMTAVTLAQYCPLQDYGMRSPNPNGYNRCYCFLSRIRCDRALPLFRPMCSLGGYLHRQYESRPVDWLSVVRQFLLHLNERLSWSQDPGFGAVN